MNDIEAVLHQREAIYGSYIAKARLIQDMKDTMRRSPNWEELPATHRESLDNIVSKIGRILIGDSFYADNWVDIAGYAMLCVKKEVI